MCLSRARRMHNEMIAVMGIKFSLGQRDEPEGSYYFNAMVRIGLPCANLARDAPNSSFGQYREKP